MNDITKVGSVAERAISRIRAREREGAAVHLRKIGYTFGEIAGELGITPGAAYKCCQRGLNRLVDVYRLDGNRLRVLELERLHALTRILFDQASDPESPPELVQGAVDKLLKISERRSRFLGLDAKEQLPAAPPDAAVVNLQEARRIMKPIFALMTKAEIEALIKITKRGEGNGTDNPVSHSLKADPLNSPHGDDGRDAGSGCGLAAGPREPGASRAENS